MKCRAVVVLSVLVWLLPLIAAHGNEKQSLFVLRRLLSYL